jgi:hypothetical protein
MPKFAWLGILSLLALAGCDNETQRYNTALRQMSTQDFGPAAQGFSFLAKDGYAPAQFRLAMLYLAGLGVPRNGRQAAYWLEKAAQQEDVGAQYMLARLYLEGIGVAHSATLAMRWFRRLAERGYVPALYQLGLMYEQGLGVDNSAVDAVAWLTKAARRRHREASLKLARAYREGLLGLAPDNEKADYWVANTKPRKF